MQITPPDFDRLFGALVDHTRRNIVWRAITAEEGIVELASHSPMRFAAVQKHVAILERAGLVTRERVGRRRVVRTNLERLRVVRRRYRDFMGWTVPWYSVPQDSVGLSVMAGTVSLQEG